MRWDLYKNLGENVPTSFFKFQLKYNFNIMTNSKVTTKILNFYELNKINQLYQSVREREREWLKYLSAGLCRYYICFGFSILYSISLCLLYLQCLFLINVYKINRTTPVSYTHLDVYKRQLYHERNEQTNTRSSRTHSLYE